MRMKNPPNEKQTAGENLRILIKTESASWDPQSGTELYLRFSGLQGSFETKPSLILESKDADLSYWAPFDPILKTTLPPNTVSSLSSFSGTPIELIINPVTLRWGKVGDISPLWPHQQFQDMVKPGRYNLSVGIGVRSLNAAKPGEWKSFSSNPIDIEVSK